MQFLLILGLIGLGLATRDTSIHHRQTRKVVKRIDENNPMLWKKWTFPTEECDDGTHYTVVHANNGQITYKDAWDACTLAGGRLAHFKNEAKYYQVTKYIQANPFINQHCAAACQLDDNACVYWVGAKTFGKDASEWQWVDSADAKYGEPIVNGWPEFPGKVLENEREANVFMFLNPDYSVEYPTFAPYQFGDYDNNPVCGFICELSNTAVSVTVPGNRTAAPSTPTPKPVTCQNGGIPVCYCDAGWTGVHCEQRVDWCQEPVIGFSDCHNDPECNGNSITYGEACQPHGRCISDNDGAYCDCDQGYWGPFCEQPANTSAIYIRRCSYMHNAKAYYEDGSPMPARDRACPFYPDEWCVPDDLTCFDPMAECANYIGWCVPSYPDYSHFATFQAEMIEMFKSEGKAVEKS